MNVKEKYTSCRWCGRPISPYNRARRLGLGAKYPVYVYCSGDCYRRAMKAKKKARKEEW